MKLRSFKILVVFSGLIAISSCKKMMDINKNPDAIPDSNSPIAQLLTSAQVNLAFEGGSDLYRYTTLIMQQMSGNASQPNQTYEYYRYNVTGSDENNVWSSIFASTLNDLQLIINQGSASPYYTGIAKILKAYEYSLVVDTWGDVPYSEAQLLSANTQPKYDDDATIYPKLIGLLSDAVNDLNASSSALVPGTNSVMYSNANFATVKTNWIKLANTLRLRLLLHTRKVDPTWLTNFNALITAAGPFFTANADGFSAPFFNLANQRNPISQFEVSRANYLYADQQMVGMMNAKADPRRAFYFTDFPFGSGSYLGVAAATPPVNANSNYSRIHTFLRGAVTAGTVPPFTYSGAAPQRMLPFAEYCFIRAEAALYGASAAGNPTAYASTADGWFKAGIAASMDETGVAAVTRDAYITTNGTLAGTVDQQLKQIIEEKYIALFGVSVEPWTDYRRTGYPVLTLPANAFSGVSAVPRTLFYPQSEIDLNPNCPAQKPANLQSKVFWDN